MTIDKDEFEIWCTNPVTEAFFDFLEQQVEITERHWYNRAWNGGELSPDFYVACRERAKVMREITSLAFEDIFGDENDTQGENTADDRR